MSFLVARSIPYITRAVVCVAILTTGVVIFKILLDTRPRVVESTSVDQVKRVETFAVPRIVVNRTWKGFATAQAMDAVDIAAEVTAIVISVPPEIRPGAQVTKGQLLVELESFDAREEVTVQEQTIDRIHARLAQLDVERANLEELVGLAEKETQISQAEYERAVEAQLRNSGNQAEVDSRRRELYQAQRLERNLQERLDLVPHRRRELEATLKLETARLHLAERDVDRCTIRSPIDGTLQAVEVDRGERVTTGMLVARLLNLDRIELPIHFPASARHTISVGDEVTLNAEGSLELQWRTTIARIAPQSDVNSRTFIAYAVVDRREPNCPPLAPGRFVQAVTRTSQGVRRLVVPRRAVLDEVVLVARDGLVERRSVIIDHYLDGNDVGSSLPDREWAVLDERSDLSEGEIVVVTNVDELRPGTRVVTVAGTAGDGS